MNRDQIDRAEKVARQLNMRRFEGVGKQKPEPVESRGEQNAKRLQERFEALEELKRWERPTSFSGKYKYKLKPDECYTFTDAQLAIAMNVLERKLNGVG